MMFTPFTEFNPISLPQTVDEVVELLYHDLTVRDRVVMSQLSESELDTSVYLVMAKMIRKEFGLYSGNGALLSNCCSYLGKDYDSHEDPAMVIMKELWKKVKKKHGLRLVSAV